MCDGVLVVCVKWLADLLTLGLGGEGQGEFGKQLLVLKAVLFRLHPKLPSDRSSGEIYHIQHSSAPSSLYIYT